MGSSLPAWAADVGSAVALAVAAVTYTAAYGEDEPHFRESDTIGYGLTVVAALALVWRRRRPAAVFAITLVAMLAYIGRNYSTGAISLALLVALTTPAADAVAALVMPGSFVLVRALWGYEGWNYRRTLISPGLVICGCIAAVFLGLALGRRAYVAEVEDRAEWA